MPEYAMNKEKKIIAIIVTYNPEVDVFRSIAKNISRQVDKLIVIDNASSNSKEFLKELINSKNIEVISLKDNYGLAYAQNYGIREAKKINATHVILFDQDSSIDDGFVDGLYKCEIELLDRSKNVAAVGPAFYDRETKSLYPATLYKGPFIKRVELIDEPVEATFIIASGSLVRMSVLNNIGYMREDFFIDFVDVEWSIRAKSKGYSVYINPRVKMEHSIGDRRIRIMGRMLSLHSDFRKFYISRNALYMARLNHIPLGYKIRVVFFNFIRSIIGIFVSEKKLASLKSIWKGWVAGFSALEKNRVWK